MLGVNTDNVNCKIMGKFIVTIGVYCKSIVKLLKGYCKRIKNGLFFFHEQESN